MIDPKCYLPTLCIHMCQTFHVNCSASTLYLKLQLPWPLLVLHSLTMLSLRRFIHSYHDITVK